MHQYRLLLISMGVIIAWLCGRFFLAENFHYAFLVWNLFLALLPLFFAEIFKRARHWAVAMVALFLWLIFFPNAPYILTDLIHWRLGTSLVWYDLFLLLGFGAVGLWTGFLSLDLVEKNLKKIRISSYILLWIFRGIIFALCSVGVYLGREIRFNSWDLFTNASSVFQTFIHDIASQEFAIVFFPWFFGLWLGYEWYAQINKSP